MRGPLKNEQDVREEIATPFLKALGYQIGTPNNIERERRLRYPALQLGRKKANDAPLPLGGSADYLLTVAGAGRWVLETKPPDQGITVDDFDQVTSYARHPEISGHYAALLNDRRFVLFFSSQTSNDTPLADLSFGSPEELADSLEGVLSPLAIRRDCKPPVADLGKPLAKGYRSEAQIVGGWGTHLAADVEPTPELPAAAITAMKQQYTGIIGTKSAVKGGRVWRDNASKIRARIAWHYPHEEMKSFLDAVGLNQFEYVCLGDKISANPTEPSVFEILNSYEMREGQAFYNLFQWRSEVLGHDANTTWQGQATGYLDGNDFVGIADFRSTVKVAILPFPIVMRFQTEFSFTVQP